MACLQLMLRKYCKMMYFKLLKPQELGYRKGVLRTGQYIYISKKAAKIFFPVLSKYILNDTHRLIFNDPFYPTAKMEASLVFHNDKHCVVNGTRDEYRLYLNRSIVEHDLCFRPNEIIGFEKIGASFRIHHFKKSSPNYETIKKLCGFETAKSGHAFLNLDDLKDIL